MPKRIAQARLEPTVVHTLAQRRPGACQRRRIESKPLCCLFVKHATRRMTVGANVEDFTPAIGVDYCEGRSDCVIAMDKIDRSLRIPDDISDEAARCAVIPVEAAEAKHGRVERMPGLEALLRLKHGAARRGLWHRISSILLGDRPTCGSVDGCRTGKHNTANRRTAQRTKDGLQDTAVVCFYIRPGALRRYVQKQYVRLQEAFGGISFPHRVQHYQIRLDACTFQHRQFAWCGRRTLDAIASRMEALRQREAQVSTAKNAYRLTHLFIAPASA